MIDELTSLLNEIMADAKEQGVPAWLVARQWADEHRSIAETDVDHAICDAMEEFFQEQFGDEPGWG